MTPIADPVEAFWQLWADGQQPDLDAFLREVGPLPLAQLAAVVRVDQRRRWQTAKPPEDPFSTVKPSQPVGVWAEAYFQQFADLQADAELAVDLIFNEFVIRDKMGQKPALAEYVRRFPAHAAVLKDQIELHQALAMQNTGTGDSTASSLKPDAKADAAPKSLGRYQIIKLLGQGGMGSVFLAQDTQLQRQVALKVPRFVGTDAPEMVERFYREARIAATFHHPHLCPVYDVGEIDGVHYLTMPYLAGEPLSAWLLRAAPLPVAAACRMACLIARAVHVAHLAGVCHRDLKPANIMLPARSTDTAPEPVVMDFGLARRGGDQDPRLTGTGVVLGTGAYMPPEQVASGAAAVGPTADVYSVGVIFYEMLTGRTPFQGTLHEVLRALLSQAPPPPRQFRPDLDPAVEAICLKALAKEPSERFQSMEEFAAALEPFWRDEVKSSESKRETPIRQKAATASAPAAPRKNARTLLVAAIGMAAILVGVCLWAVMNPSFFSPGPEPAAKHKLDGLARGDAVAKVDDKVEKKPDAQPGSKVDGASNKKKTEKPDKEPAQREVLKGHSAGVFALAFHPHDPDLLASGSADGTVRIWDIATGKYQVLKGTPGKVLAVAFSPDGKRVASAGGDRPNLVWDVLLWDLAGARVTAKFKDHFSEVTGLAFSPDGKTLASSSGDNTIRLWGVDNNKGEESKRLQSTTWVNSVRFNPMNPKMLASAAGSDSTVSLWDITTGKKMILAGHERDVLAVAFSPDGRTLASASEDRTIKLWDVATQQNTKTLTGHEKAVNAVAFNHDGTQLVSGSDDGALKLWDVATEKCIATLDGHKDGVHAVAFSSNGRTVASGGKDNTVILWNIPKGGN